MLEGLVECALILTMQLSLPIVIVATVVGVVVGLLQALTQIQDQTLPHAVKLVAAGVVILTTGAGFSMLLVRFAEDVFSRIAGG